MDGRFISANSAAEMLLGYTQDEMMQLTVADITAPEFLAVVQDMTDLKVDRGGRTTYEVEVLAKDGRRVPLEVSSWLVSTVIGQSRSTGSPGTSPNAIRPRRRCASLRNVPALCWRTPLTPSSPLTRTVR